MPGDAPEETTLDHSKGFVLGYIAVLSPTLTNSFHWGFTRQSFGIVGNTDQQWNTFLGLDQGITYSHNFQVPLHNFVDDVSWTKENSYLPVRSRDWNRPRSPHKLSALQHAGTGHNQLDFSDRLRGHHQHAGSDQRQPRTRSSMRQSRRPQRSTTVLCWPCTA